MDIKKSTWLIWIFFSLEQSKAVTAKDRSSQIPFSDAAPQTEHPRLRQTHMHSEDAVFFLLR